MSKTSRVTVTLSVDVLEHIDHLALKLNCSRSALISELLSQSLPALASLAACLPSPGSTIDASDVRRLRGESARIIGDQVSRLILGARDDMF